MTKAGRGGGDNKGRAEVTWSAGLKNTTWKRREGVEVRVVRLVGRKKRKRKKRKEESESVSVGR